MRGTSHSKKAASQFPASPPSLQIRWGICIARFVSILFAGCPTPLISLVFSFASQRPGCPFGVSPENLLLALPSGFPVGLRCSPSRQLEVFTERAGWQSAWHLPMWMERE